MTLRPTPPPLPEGYAPGELPNFTPHQGVLVACAPKGMQREVVQRLARHICRRIEGDNPQVPWVFCDDPEHATCGCDGNPDRAHFFLKDESNELDLSTDDEDDEDDDEHDADR